jgi:hypothetical protein
LAQGALIAVRNGARKWFTPFSLSNADYALPGQVEALPEALAFDDDERRISCLYTA